MTNANRWAAFTRHELEVLKSALAASGSGGDTGYTLLAEVEQALLRAGKGIKIDMRVIARSLQHDKEK